MKKILGITGIYLGMKALRKKEVGFSHESVNSISSILWQKNTSPNLVTDWWAQLRIVNRKLLSLEQQIEHSTPTLTCQIIV